MNRLLVVSYAWGLAGIGFSAAGATAIGYILLGAMMLGLTLNVAIDHIFAKSEPPAEQSMSGVGA